MLGAEHTPGSVTDEETMDATSTEQQRAEAAEKRQAAMQALADNQTTNGQIRTDPRKLHPRLAETSPSRRSNGNEQPANPGLMDRYLGFPGELRAETVERDGKQFHRVEGYATVFGREYEMWDVFGPYDEVVLEGAADHTLAAKPDVVFKVNHHGLALARTGGPWNSNNSTLDLTADPTGLKDVAWLNPERSEVKDLMLGIGDQIITEQSFAFQIDEGLWDDDFTKFQIVRFDLNRGDVSAVNYGANPYTSIAARQQEILTDLRMAGPATARAMLHTLLQRTDLLIDQEVDRIDTQRRESAVEAAGKGRSLAQIEAMLQS